MEEKILKIAILMLTHNAPKYVYECITTLEKTKLNNNLDYDLIVLDNKSNFFTKYILKYLKNKGKINYLHFNDHNAFFAKGNNMACKFASDDITHYLLLNSDIRINSGEWLERLVSIHPKEGGISSFGAVLGEPIRADGYCMLIDRFLYDKYQLDEEYEWWWSVTKLQSQIIKDNYLINAVVNHEKYIHHYGGKSGKSWKDAKGMKVDINFVKSWFMDKKDNIRIIEDIDLKQN